MESFESIVYDKDKVHRDPEEDEDEDEDEDDDDEEEEEMRKFSWILWASILAACLNGVAVGNLSGWPMATLPKLLDDHKYTPIEVSWIAGIFYMGMLSGGFAAMVLASWYGKRWLFLIASVPLLLGWGIITLAASFWQLLIGRIILGLGGGLICYQTEMYMSEISRTSWRPRVSIIFCASIQLGVLMSYASQHYLPLTIAPGVYLCVVMFLAMLYLTIAVETPYWLIRKERLDKGLVNLRKLRGDEDVSDEFREIVEFVEKSQCVSTKHTYFWSSIRKVMSERANRRGIILVILLTTAQQFSGMAAIHSYAMVIFQRSVVRLQNYEVAMLIGLIELGCCLGSSYLVMHTKRRTLVAWGTSMCAGAMALMGLFFHEIKNDPKDDLGLPRDISSDNGGLAIICIVVFSLAYGLGLSTMPTVIAAECLSIDARNLGAAIQNTVVCCSMFIVTQVWMIITTNFGQEWAFFITSLITGAHCLILLYIQPETSGKTLMEIQRMLNKKYYPRGKKKKPRKKEKRTHREERYTQSTAV